MGFRDGAGAHSRHRRHERSRSSVGPRVSARRRHARHGAAGTAARDSRRRARSETHRRVAADSRRRHRRSLRRRAASAVRAQPARLFLVLEARQDRAVEHDAGRGSRALGRRRRARERRGRVRRTRLVRPRDGRQESPLLRPGPGRRQLRRAHGVRPRRSLVRHERRSQLGREVAGALLRLRQDRPDSRRRFDSEEQPVRRQGRLSGPRSTRSATAIRPASRCIR